MHIKIIHAALFTPTNLGWGLPILMIGGAGEGKSAIIESIAAACGLPCEVLSPGERGEGAFGVIPVPRADGYLSYPMPEWSARMTDDTGGVVFVDEVTCAPPALQSPLLGLIGAKRLGGGRLGPRVRVIGAANPPEIAANGYDLSPPLANRFGWVQWDAPTCDEHRAYMMGGATSTATKVNAKAEEARVLAEWGDAWAYAVGVEAGYLGAQPTMKNVPPRNVAQRAFPSDRTWEMATRALASARIHKLTDDERGVFVAAFIGEAAYATLSEYIKKTDLPNAADVLDGVVTFTHDSRRLDRTYAVLSAATAIVLPKNAPKRVDRAKKLWKLIETLSADHQDLGVPSIEALVKEQLIYAESTNVLSKSQHTLSNARQAAP